MQKFRLLVILMAFAIFFVTTACSNDESSTGAKESGDKDSSYKIKVAYMNFGTNLEDLPQVQEEINKITKEKINATVELESIGVSAWANQSNLMLTGGEKLDLILSTSVLGNYALQAVRGQFLALDDLLESNGQDILNVFSEDVLDGTRVDGKIYAIPSVREWGADYGFIMRKDIVDKYNIDLSQVKTYEDLTNVFKIVKENEPDLTPIVNVGNGATGSRLGGMYDSLGDGFGVINYHGDPNKVINLFEDQDYIDQIKLTRAWYEAGYLMKDAATSKETAANLIKANKGFGYFNNLKPGFEAQESRLTGHEMVSVSLSDSYMATTGATAFGMSIARNSENPEKAMDFLNLLYSDKDIMNLLANGIEGKHYSLNSDGFISLPEGVEDSRYVFNNWMIGNNYLTYVWEGDEPDHWENLKKFNDAMIKSPAYGFTFEVDPVKTEIAACTNVLNQYQDGLGSGTLDPEKSLVEFNEKLKAAGLDKIIAEKQRQYDEWLKKQ